MAEKVLQVEHLEKSYQKKHVLHDINFSVAQGEVVTLLGPSGSGKSTLIRCLNGLEVYQKGTITFEGQKIIPTEKNWQQIRQKIGMVFQSYDLFPNLTVMDNILLGPTKVQKKDKATARSEALALLKSVELDDYANAYPRELSGGQKQRVAIVRALALHPDFMLFDEVTASLDPEMVRGVLTIIENLANRDNMTMIVVTHEMNFAKQIADRVLFLQDGRILEQTPSEQFFTAPQTDRAKVFLDSMDF
ncbi:amino acid ABC transporter ATP-binding protein [Lentilactobacillus hilgardii]|uniref:ABC transporter, ATP-binding protein n=1 Tax=Lentilactobacillus hilgardii (strain ATCC 8290 / DSM 20176 / CCUG 30140 / JCM 1155 / KCTC 3500 / NBRC 15886 / NCIMB 8040 / NRRL B-1843 / 9) TaxID=1423757 RepID=C0XJ24_LENH9|nr:amino acid ABC transporter ATP-binding protein [Lentilactobacillus hilgardii]EEI20785.1 ABC transporter, ATP-binding protein [Lentilactobacillus buchneri ATCC 11577]EEI24603.1 ABC transporter, ATP-binding protein [Lentilactobacillus hilgardii DSM 20176 = ATCC 8290]KRK57328.1 ABC superfamily ATP binding cassette transporter, ABC protein [Lentilactobacillus hilgardii DSM 20176 = ATCC 8290]MCT3395049.1 amino acid ABC transporter ATP-binding protein [Lentilactobacillus hilgardii]QEU37614.1 amin